MKTCALCQIRPADKTNTHFLTDGIIRNCLNIDGSSTREKGLYFDVSNTNSTIEFNFQRNTPIIELEQAIGRDLNEDEIEKAKEIPFSVDNVFCSECEDIFTNIENSFTQKILPQLRERDLSQINFITSEEINTIRLFFYLQIWRLAICEDSFKIKSETMDLMRKWILNPEGITNEELNIYPLSITYLESTERKTVCFVGYTNDLNPNIIFMNDFIVQFYNSSEEIKFLDFYGLNKGNFRDNINLNEHLFFIPIMHNEERIDLVNQVLRKEKTTTFFLDFENFFRECWLRTFGNYPHSRLTKECLGMLIYGNYPDATRYTEANIREHIIKYMGMKVGIF